MNGKNLQALIKRVENCKDMDQAEELYEQILSIPELSLYKSSMFIANLKWNRAINLEAIVNWYLYESEKPLFIRAHTMLKIAHQEMTDAVSLYKKASQKKKVDEFRLELQTMLDKLELTLEGKCAQIPALIQAQPTNQATLVAEEDLPSSKKTKFGEHPSILLSEPSQALSALSNPDSCPPTIQISDTMQYDF